MMRQNPASVVDPVVPVVVVTPGESSSSAAFGDVVRVDPAAVVPRGVELIDSLTGERVGEVAGSGAGVRVDAVTLDVPVPGPSAAGSGWPWAVGPWVMGLGLVVIAALMLASVLIWARVSGVWAGGVVLMGRCARSVGEVRAVRSVARHAGEPVVAVLLSRSAYDRGVRAMVEAKSGVPVGVGVLRHVEAVRSRVFA